MSRGQAYTRWLPHAGLCLALVGCAAPAPRPDAQALATATWHWSGRIALQIESDPPQNLSGGFELNGRAEAGELRLLSPFGQTLAIAHWSAEGARLQRGSDTRDYADTDSLTRELTGTPLPLATLFDWLQGQDTALDGWSVDLSQYPQGKLSARRTQPLPVTHLRLVIQ
ncbi:MAG TPA: lipoprotein insertase outer membrane protein LolB [Macromonas sp.]|nr:lipoprotein insertase outer membrane protein LolB [Macromonas sp.]